MMAIFNKNHCLTLAFICVFGSTAIVHPQDDSHFIAEVFPSAHVYDAAPHTNITITFINQIKVETLHDSTLVVFGSQSGFHSGDIKYDSSANAIIFDPYIDFFHGELVHAVLTSGVEIISGAIIENGYIWSFNIGVSGGTGLFHSEIDYNTTAGVQSIYGGDFDDDGDVDFATAMVAAGNNVAIYINNGDGLFEERQILTVGDTPRSIAGGDIDNDGDIDLITANSGSNSFSILSNLGDGSFIFNRSEPVGDNPVFVVLSDFNADGKIDPGIVNRGINSISIHLNQGNGTFQDVTVYETREAPRTLFAGDFNLDGTMDIATTELESNQLIIFENDGSGAFQFLNRYMTGSENSQPHFITGCDINGDSDLDILVTNRGIDSILVLQNRGDGNFLADSSYATGAEPRAIFSGDLDHDKNPDIITANFAGNNINIHLNNGAGSFILDSLYVTGSWPRFIFGGDLDKDGDIDLVVANYNSRTISILKNLNSTTQNFYPDAPELIEPQHRSYLSNPKPECRWKVPSDRNGDSLHFRVELAGDGTRIYDSSANSEGFIPIPPLAEGNGEGSYFFQDSLVDSYYNWRVLAKDDNSLSAASTQWQFIVDATPPKIDSLKNATQPDFLPNWFNQTITSELELILFYDEIFALMAKLETGNLDSIVVDSVNSGFDQTIHFSIDMENIGDGDYWFISTVSDSAGNYSKDSLQIRLDSSPPENATANSAVDTSMFTSFPIFWNEAIDSGCGVSGYDVRVKIDDGEWFDWVENFPGTSSVFQGEHLRSYAFEVRARDNVGNFELFTNTAEVFVFVDTNLTDVTAPSAPIHLTAGDENPSPWQSNMNFIVNWENPNDPTGIIKSLYKLDDMPQFKNDTTGTGPGLPPFEINATQEDGQDIFLWLQDGNGNVDFRNWARTNLRYDNTRPKISRLQALNPDFFPNWYNQRLSNRLKSKLYYHESHAAQASAKFAEKIIVVDSIPSGQNQMFEFSIEISDIEDGDYFLTSTLIDSANNTASSSILVRLDKSPPIGAVANSPDTSINQTFPVFWGNTANDASGSGLSGRYNIKIKIDQGAWSDWLLNYNGEDSIYVGEHGHTYSFEAGAIDNVGNEEIFAEIAETKTVVDTTFSDVNAPLPPVEVLANGSSPGPWSADSCFKISWKNPYDPSGIARCLYKLGDLPTSNYDTTGTTAANRPFEIIATKENGQILYLWLQDGRGNIDYQNFAFVLLRYDATHPQIDSLVVLNPDFPPHWYNQDSTEMIKMNLFYSEIHPFKVNLIGSLMPALVQEQNIEPGINQKTEIEIKISALRDGEYEVKAVITDSAGNQGISPDITVNLDATPPTISQIPYFLIDEGNELTISATVKDNNQVVNTKLLYRKGGQVIFNFVDMNAIDDTIFQAIIPGDFIGDRGLDYLISASDGLSKSYAPLFNGSAVPNHVKVRVLGKNNQGIFINEPLPYGSEQNAFRMISLPLLVDDPEPASVLVDDFGEYDKKMWRFFQYNPQREGYIEFPETENFKPGKAFWLIVREAGKIVDTGVGTSVPVDSPFVITLNNGWNDIGNPFNFSVEWNRISVSSGNMHDIMGPYTYRNRWLIPTEISKIDPWAGYSVYTEKENISLFVPPVESFSDSPGMLKKYAEAEDWHIKIEAHCQQSKDIANYVGCAKYSSREWDEFDYLEPPPIGGYVSLSFPHEDWDFLPGQYTTDFRPEFNRGESWDFTIITNIENADVELRIVTDKEFSPSLEYFIYDISGYTKINLKTDDSYLFTSFSGITKRFFRLAIGDLQYIQGIEQQIPQAPTNFLLAQNYPNPFNSETNIKYQIPQQSQVTIKIFNLLGQEVRELISDHREIGYFNTIWDGKNNSGVMVGSGIYVVFMKAGNTMRSKKLILMK